MQGIGVGSHPDSTRYIVVALYGGASRSIGCDARLHCWCGGIKAQGLLEDAVEKWKGLDGASGGEDGVLVVRMDDWRAEREEFVAEPFL